MAEEANEKSKYDAPKLRLPDSKSQLDLDDLDEDERKALAEVKKKGYYHARPANAPAPTPQRIDNPEDIAAAASTKKPIKWTTTPKPVANDGELRKRSAFDEYQKKWDRFDKEEPVVREVKEGSKKHTQMEPAGLLGQGKLLFLRCCGRRKGK